jgi:hypothetical protein
MEEKCPHTPENPNTIPANASANLPPGLVDAVGLGEALCPDPRSRPSLRTIRRWQKMRLVPFLKIGTRVFFDPVQVRRALDARFTVSAR